MPTSGLLHPLRSDGTLVDATFEVSSVPVFEIVYHHKAGARGSLRSVNADYHEGLELLLTRLASIEASILGVMVDSGIARELPPGDRELALPFPIQLHDESDVADLRLEITRAQRPIARREGVKPSGGNDQKRIRITVALKNGNLGIDRLSDLLVGDAH